MKKAIILVCSIATFVTHAQAQVVLEHSVKTTGGKFVALPSIQISWTIGQGSSISTITGSGYTFTQGFQQGDTASGVYVNELNIPDVSVSIFPNPSTDNLFIRMDYKSLLNMKLKLYNLPGQLLRNISINEIQCNKETEMNIQGISQGLYLLEIIAEDNGKMYHAIKKINIIH